MRIREIPWLIAVLLVFGACGKKEVPESPGKPEVLEAPVESPPTAPVVQPVVEVPVLTPDERAAKLGFIRHLPQDTGVVMSFYQVNRNISRIQAGKFWRSLDLVPDMGLGGSTELTGPWAMFGKEFTIALGKSVGEQTGNLLTLNRRLGYLQMRGLARAMAETARSGDASALEEGMNRYNLDLFRELLADPESGVTLLERLKMPPLYLAFRTEPDMLDAAAQQLGQLTEFLGMLGDVVEPVEIEKAGQSFAGYKVSGAKVSESVAAGRAEFEEMLEPGMVDRLLAAIAKRDLVVLSGSLGDYAVLFFGSSEDDLDFASDIGDSLAAGETLAFCDAHAAKDLVAMTYGGKQAIKQMIDAAGGFSDMVTGFRDGLAESDGLGDTRDIEALLRMVAEREASLRGLAHAEGGGMVAFLEDGLKIESYGGTDSGAIDWGASNKLGALGDSENVVLFANMTGNALYDEKSRAWFEALMETAYAMAMKFSELPLKGGDIARFKEVAGMLDKKIRPDAVALWESLGVDLRAGLGAERALVVDLNGSAPLIPGLPQELLDDAKFPRVSLVAPVADREKIASAWQGINRSATGIIATIGEMNGQELPMPKPISSEKNGFTTWFLPLPFFNDDFVPSVTVGDEWFAASSSKNQALDLLSKSGTGEVRSGLWFTLDFQALRVFSEETLDLFAKHPGALPLEDLPLDQIRDLASATEGLDKLTAHCRREKGVLRTSIHFKKR